jgi:type II secretory pathway component PulL
MGANFSELELDRTCWRLLARGEDAAPSVVQREFAVTEFLAQPLRIREALDAGDYQGDPIVVALASTLTLSTTLMVSRQQELRDRQTVLYRLEECIPWGAEECIADYSRANGAALAVAAHEQPLGEFFAELEKLGIRIQSILPKALLAVTEHVGRGNWPEQHIVAFQQTTWIDLLFVDAGAPVTWCSFPVEGTALGFEIRRIALEHGHMLPFVSYLLPDGDAGITELVAANVIQLHPITETTYDASALTAAEKLLSSELDPPLELKRDAFGRKLSHTALRRYSVALQLTAIVLLLVSAGGLLYRGRVASREADRVASREIEAFQRVFPNTKVPVGIRGRLESELAKLKGLQGDETSQPNSVSAIKILHGLLAALPADRRFRLLEIRIEEGRLYVDGEVRDHGDAELIAQRLRAGGFEVASPRTQRVDDKRISLRVTGTMAPDIKIASRKSP